MSDSGGREVIELDAGELARLFVDRAECYGAVVLTIARGGREDLAILVSEKDPAVMINVFAAFEKTLTEVAAKLTVKLETACARYNVDVAKTRERAARVTMITMQDTDHPQGVPDPS